MATLTIPAHLLSPEFRTEIKRDFNVDVIDESNAPWEVVFQGTPIALRAMYAVHWADQWGDIGDEIRE